MIYDYPSVDEPIRQGDIFVGLPRVELSLRQIPVVTASGVPEIRQWNQLATTGEPVTALLPVKPVAAIVASQDCDCTHGRDLTLCEIRPFREVEGKAKDATKPSSWVKIVTVSTTLNFIKARYVRARYVTAGESSHEMRAPIPFVADSASCPEASFLGKETFSRFEGFINTLPSREKLFLNLHYNRDLSLEEIAGILKMSKGALYTMKSRLQKKMKEVLLETDNAN